MYNAFSLNISLQTLLILQQNKTRQN